MILRQKLLFISYPMLRFLGTITGLKNFRKSSNITAPASFFELPVFLNNGDTLELNDRKEKLSLFVNTASDCGYTRQYDALQKLHQEHKNDLLIIAFPSNDFKKQEQGNDDEIAKFCRLNFGVTFPIAIKAPVTKIPGQSKIFRWLTSKEMNGWNDNGPSWNFCKYLVDQKGNLRYIFGPGVDPLSGRMKKAINSLLG